MPVVRPKLILLRDLNVFILLVRLSFVDDCSVCDLAVRLLLDWQKVESHGLIGELVHKRSEQIHATVCDQQRASWPRGLWREVLVEFGVEIQLILDEAREM